MNRGKVNTDRIQYLIKDCIRGKRAAQSELFQFFAPKMFALCLYYSKNKADAEDFLQNGFIKVFDNIKKYKAKGSFEGWMRKVFVNMILEDFRRKKQLFVEMNDNSVEISNDEANVYDKITSEEMIELVQELSPAYRMVFNLYAIEGYKHNEIAELLNISVGTSKSNLARARNILQKRIKHQYEISTLRHGQQ